MSKIHGSARVPGPRHPWYSTTVSSVVAILVSAALALAPAPVRLPFQDLEAHVQDLAGKKKYRELAVAGVAAFERRDLEPYQRREMAFFAIRGLHGVFEATGEVSSLCDAGRLMRRLQAEVGFGEDAGTAARLKKATERYLVETGVSEPCPRKKPVRSSAPVAARPATRAPTNETRLTPTVGSEPHPNPATSAADDELLAVVAEEPRSGDVHKDIPDGRRPAVILQAPPPPASGTDRDAARPARLTHGALALLALGAVGGVGLGVTLHFRGRASDSLDALRATADMRGESTPDEYARARDLNESYRGLTVAAGVGGALAVVGVVGAVTLFALRARRGSTLAGPWVGPAGAGLSIRGRF